MSITRDEFAELLELFDEFDIGEDAGERFTFTNPVGNWSPLEPDMTEEEISGRGILKYHRAAEVQNAIGRGDAQIIVRCDEYADFEFSQNTKCINDLGDKYEITLVESPPKNLIKIINVRQTT